MSQNPPSSDDNGVHDAAKTADRPDGRRAYTAPALKAFGPMKKLTRLGAGPVEDLFAYGGPS